MSYLDFHPSLILEVKEFLMGNMVAQSFQPLPLLILDITVNKKDIIYSSPVPEYMFDTYSDRLSDVFQLRANHIITSKNIVQNKKLH